MAFAVFATVQRQRQSAGACVPGAVYQAPNRFRSCDACDDIKYVGQHPKSEHHTLFHVICVTGCVKFRLRVKSCSFVKLTYEFTLPGDSGDKYTSCCVTCGPCRLGGCSTTGELGPSHPTVGQPLNRHGSHVTQHDVHVTARWRLRTERSDIPAVPSTITKWSRRSCASAVRVFGHHKASFAPVGCGKHAHSPG
jgi:hypothetical protein